jgi:transcription initiation factor TFIIIB Brf1 subunit/transcription initiation factor TFIIB
MFLIRKKKLLQELEEWQKEIRISNQNVKRKFIEEKKDRQARDMQLYEDGNDNAFNLIKGRIGRSR